MKKIIQLFTAILLLIGSLVGIRLVLGKTQAIQGGDQLFIFNWGDYIDPALIKVFEEETGYQVIYESFDSNEAMLTKIEQGSTAYDIAFPSDYTVSAMIDKDLLLPLDSDKIEGIENLDPRFLDQSFDPGNQYSLPYFWGSLGILYNEKWVDEADITSWNDLWRPEFKDSLLMVDGAREFLGIGLQSLGYSLNETDRTRLNEASDKLSQLMPNVKALLMDEIKLYIVQEEAPLAVTYSGEVAAAIAENPDLNYLIPQEGSNIWFDNMVIPKTAQNVAGAYAFINFMLRPEIAAQNATYIEYSTPNAKAMQYLPSEMRENALLYPSDELIDQLEVYENLGKETLIVYNDLFLELKLFPQVVN